ncbi:MAG: MaoC family dehydratase N-terminal domain-containing protein [Chloroflexi bacterium]|nr:MaoC family dehydratase N-terminal domain-containing protein [Chloroflexota bacterium]
MRYFEDMQIGDKVKTKGKTLTDSIVTTVVALGGYTEPFFHDEEYAKTTQFGGRIAPGILAVLVGGGLSEQAGYFAGSTIAMMGMDNIKFIAPIKPGDTIRVKSEITDKKETSKPDRGLVFDRKMAINQRGEVVVQWETVHLVKRRPKS